MLRELRRGAAALAASGALMAGAVQPAAAATPDAGVLNGWWVESATSQSMTARYIGTIDGQFGDYGCTETADFGFETTLLGSDGGGLLTCGGLSELGTPVTMQCSMDFTRVLVTIRFGCLDSGSSTRSWVGALALAPLQANSGNVNGVMTDALNPGAA
jgi:hypothetical protein